MRVLVVAQEKRATAELLNDLVRGGFVCSAVPRDEQAADSIASQSPDVLLVEVDSRFPVSAHWEALRRVKQQKHLQIIALVSSETLSSIENVYDADDFLVSPYDVRELVTRIDRLVRRNEGAGGGELIRCDGLVIDVTNCEVTVDGKVVELTFKEYELLKLLAANRGRVYKREELLNKIWGYDYYGGDRTVDVHIRRLRSKIERSPEVFIETVRNVGYRFRKDR